jgi:hypothetical protein
MLYDLLSEAEKAARLSYEPYLYVGLVLGILTLISFAWIGREAFRRQPRRREPVPVPGCKVSRAKRIRY